jgi:CRP-like cAMP-binding protein/rhodanese-related sulfurtransferase
MNLNDRENILNILAQSAVFRDLPKDALDAAASVVRTLVAPRRTIIFREGDPGDSLYILSKGKVRIFRRDSSGMEINLATLEPGDTFGEMALLSGETRSAGAEVLEEAHLMVLAKDDFDRILRDFPDTAKIFFRAMRRRLLTDEKRLEVEAVEAYKASRVSWFDFVLVVGVSMLLAIIFNYSNPNGIPLFPQLPDRSRIPVISAETALEEVRRDDALVVDAMPDNFYQKGHIRGAVNMPLGIFDIVYAMTFAEENKERKIIVYGESISKHYDVELADKLLLRGFNNVSILEGGLEAWEKKGYPVEEKGKS